MTEANACTSGLQFAFGYARLGSRLHLRAVRLAQRGAYRTAEAYLDAFSARYWRLTGRLLHQHPDAA